MTLTPITRLRQWMQPRGYTCLLVRTRANFAWLTGGKDNHIVLASEQGVADLLVFATRIVCLTLAMEGQRIAEEELANFEVDVIAPPWYTGLEAAREDLLAGERVAADVPHPATTFVGEELMQLRRTLDPPQLEQYRDVCTRAALALEAVAMRIERGMTEFDIAGLISAACLRSECTPGVILVATDERIARYRHPIPTARRMVQYAMLVVCAEKYGLYANLTRFVHFGPLSAQLADMRDKCAYIDVCMNVATRPGATVATVFEAALSAYHETSIAGEWEKLHLGGPTGYAPREFLATRTREDRICVNQVYTWNPSATGFKSEDTLLVAPIANEYLTHTGNWPYTSIKMDGQTHLRPDVLVRPF